MQAMQKTVAIPEGHTGNPDIVLALCPKFAKQGMDQNPGQGKSEICVRS